VPGVAELVERAAAIGYRSLALTDFCSLTGIPEFVSKCRFRSIKPIVGAEIPIELNAGNERLVDRVILLAENEQGYGNLSRLITQFFGQWSKFFPLAARDCTIGVPLDQLAEFSDGLIAILGPEESHLEHYFVNAHTAEATSYATQLLSVFPASNTFVAVTSARTAAAIKIFCRTKRIQPVACPAVYYLSPSDRLAYLYLRRDPCPSSFSPDSNEEGAGLNHLARHDEVEEFFHRDIALLSTTLQIADRCRALTGTFRTRFPVLELPRGVAPDSYLRDQLAREVERLYPEQTPLIRDRLSQEFNALVRAGLAEKFILLHALMRHCREHGVTVGVGSGEIVTSLIAYALGLTQVDPIHFRLNFSGFNTATNSASADSFAIEVPSEAAPVIAKFFDERLGSLRCARVGQFTPMPRAALVKDLLAWMGADPQDAGEIDITERDETRPFNSFVKTTFSSVTLPDVQVAAFLLSRLLGRPHEFSFSENEIAISSDRLDCLVPLVRVEGQEATQVEADGLNTFRIPRLILSTSPHLRALDMAARWIRDEEDYDVTRAPLDDGRTFELLRRGLTLGIEPFQSMHMRGLLRREAPQNFNGLLKVRAAEAALANDSRDIRHFIPECLLGYRLAYVKAHFPACFFAAMFSRLAQAKQTRRLAPFFREAREMGVKILGPDINRSAYNFTIERNAVRCGLSLVKLVGERTYREIDAARARGEFQDLVDLRRRTERRVVNSAVLENLIRAGALDCFELNRNELLAMLRQLVEAEAEDYTSLLSPDFELQPPDLPAPSPREIAEQEISATDVAISVELLQEYASLLKRTRAQRFGMLSRRCVGREVTLAGYINYIDDEPIRMGNVDVYLLDFDGYPVLVPAKVRDAFAPAFSPNEPVLILGHGQADANAELAVKAFAVYTLAEVEHLSQAVAEIELNLAEENLHTMRLLYGLLRRFRRGSTTITIASAPPTWSCQLFTRLMHKRRVFFCPPLYNQLKTILTENQVTLHFRDSAAQEHAMRLLAPFRYGKNPARNS
jgi:DNA polymerase III alpha subunit